MCYPSLKWVCMYHPLIAFSSCQSLSPFSLVCSVWHMLLSLVYSLISANVTTCKNTLTLTFCWQPSMIPGNTPTSLFVSKNPWCSDFYLLSGFLDSPMSPAASEYDIFYSFDYIYMYIYNVSPLLKSFFFCPFFSAYTVFGFDECVFISFVYCTNVWTVCCMYYVYAYTCLIGYTYLCMYK